MSPSWDTSPPPSGAVLIRTAPKGGGLVSHSKTLKLSERFLHYKIHSLRSDHIERPEKDHLEYERSSVVMVLRLKGVTADTMGTSRSATPTAIHIQDVSDKGQ